MRSFRSVNVILLLTVLFSKKQCLNLRTMLKNSPTCKIGKMKKTVSKAGFAAVLVFCASVVAPVLSRAQAGFDNTTDGGYITDIPLDGGTVFLVIAGVVFGAYKLYKMSQRSNALNIAR